MLGHLGAGVHENFQRLKSLGAWHQFHTCFRKGKAGLPANHFICYLQMAHVGIICQPIEREQL